MAFACRIEADSVSPSGIRLTTFVVTYPRIIHAELLTHRLLSRNSASSRAIPVSRMITDVEDDPYIPSEWGTNQKGMQAGELLPKASADGARCAWLRARFSAVLGAQALMNYGVHKQLANRLLEPFSWITVVITATDWANFFALRCHPDAHPEFQRIADMMRRELFTSVPMTLNPGDWHLPFVPHSDVIDAHSGVTVLEQWKLVSAGRCARVSYLTHEGKHDPDTDVALARRLIAATPKHASPFEHVATPAKSGETVKGNFRGWHQFRHQIHGESVGELV